MTTPTSELSLPNVANNNASIPIATFQDANNNRTLQGTAGYVNAGVATPVTPQTPLPAVDVVAGTALGTPADAAWSGTGAASVIAAIKALVSKFGAALPVVDTGTETALTAIEAGMATAAAQATALTQQTAAATALGVPADTAWVSGNGGVIGLLKAAIAAIKGTLVVSGSAAVGSPPTSPPLSVSGVDGSGNKQHLATDTSGRQVVVSGGNVGTNRSSTSPPNVPTDNTSDAGSTTTATLSWNGNSLVILAVFPANTNRIQAEVLNLTGQQAVLVFDDGAGGNLRTMEIDPSTVGTQGGAYRTNVEKGRIRVFGATGTYVYAGEN